MNKAKVSLIADVWAMSIEAAVEVAAKVPENKEMTQLQDGKSHPVWLLGHMAFAASFPVLAVALGKSPVLPLEWLPKFGPDFAGGQPASADASNYPSWVEIVEGYKKSGAAAVAAIRDLEDSDLAGTVKGNVPEGLEANFNYENLESALLTFVRHNTHHTGQLALLAALD